MTLLLALGVLLGVSGANPQGGLGASPQDAWICPLSHPIKGNFTTSTGEPCIYHIPSGRFYPKIKPERCYATEDAAQKMAVCDRSDKQRQAPSHKEKHPYDYCRPGIHGEISA